MEELHGSPITTPSHTQWSMVRTHLHLVVRTELVLFAGAAAEMQHRQGNPGSINIDRIHCAFSLECGSRSIRTYQGAECVDLSTRHCYCSPVLSLATPY